MRVLIAGCGYTGCALGERLVAEGHNVFGLRRNPTGLPPAIHPVAADLASGSLDALPPNLDFVFHSVSPDDSTDSAYRAAYVEGLRNLLRVLAVRRERLRRVILISSTGVYAQRRGEWVDETSPAEPDGRAGRRLLEGERLALGGPFPATVLRAGGIYGPGRTGAIERAMNAVRGDEPPSYSNRIHRDDLAGVLRHLMLMPAPEPLYLGVDHEPADRRTVTEWLASQTGDGSLRGTGRPSERTRTNKRCSNARIVASGYVFRYPTFREGFASVLEEMDVPLRRDASRKARPGTSTTFHEPSNKGEKT